MPAVASFRLFYSFIDGSGFGNPIQEENLEERQTEDIQNTRRDPFHRKIGGLADHPVQSKLPPQHPLHEMTDKSFFPPIQGWMGLKQVVQGVFGES